MKLQDILIFLGVLLLALVAGCTKSTATTATAEVQKHVLQQYLEGLRDKDFAKLQKTTHPRVFAGWPQEPNQLREYLTKTQQNTGNFKSWEFESNPFVDSLNGQSIIKTNLVTDKYRFEMAYDLRRLENNWGVYGVQTTKQVSIAKTKGKKPIKMTP